MQKITKKELAEMLNDTETARRREITKREEQLAKENGLVVVFGASDDLMEFRGAIDNEIGCYDGGKAFFDENGLLESECDNDECVYFERIKEKSKKIEAIWDEDGLGYCWTYKTEIPHETFDILENFDGNITKYCRGIVFDIKDLK